MPLTRPTVKSSRHPFWGGADPSFGAASPLLPERRWPRWRRGVTHRGAVAWPTSRRATRARRGAGRGGTRGTGRAEESERGAEGEPLPRSLSKGVGVLSAGGRLEARKRLRSPFSKANTLLLKCSDADVFCP